MADEEFLSRIDEHMARGNEHMARGNEHMARGNELMTRGNELMTRGNELMDQIRAEFDLNRRTYQEQLQIAREVVRRNEIAFRENSRVLADLVVAVREIKDEVRAQTQAILRVLDRLDDGGAEPAGA